MRPGIVIVLKILGQNAMQMFFVEHDHMVETFATNGTDDSLAVGILPRRMGCNQDFVDSHVLDSLLEVIAIDMARAVKNVSLLIE